MSIQDKVAMRCINLLKDDQESLEIALYIDWALSSDLDIIKLEENLEKSIEDRKKLLVYLQNLKR